MPGEVLLNPPARVPSGASGYQRFGVIESLRSQRHLDAHAWVDGVIVQPVSCNQPLTEYDPACVEVPLDKGPYLNVKRESVTFLPQWRVSSARCSSFPPGPDVEEAAQRWLDDQIELAIEDELGAQLLASVIPQPPQTSVVCAVAAVANAISATAGPPRGVLFVSVEAALVLLSTEYLVIQGGKLYDKLGNLYVVLRTAPEPNTVYGVSDAQIELWLSETVNLVDPLDAIRDHNDRLARYEQGFLLVNTSCPVYSAVYTECN